LNVQKRPPRKSLKSVEREKETRNIASLRLNKVTLKSV
jgi:hypothetical protein